MTRLALAALVAWASACCPAAGAANPAAVAHQASLQEEPALHVPWATSEMMLAATNAGGRLVAVGDHGVVLLSDDQGKRYRQARSVPTRATLTGVSFSDARNGWAVGQWGVVIHTRDGGETWTLQRSDTSVDQPLFAVYFLDGEHGIAAGLWSLLLMTDDGGQHWNKLALPAPPGGGQTDRNLFSIFAAPGGTLFIAAERGTVLRSTDRGASWQYVNTGYKGSLWTGCALHDGTLLVAGLRGSVYRSTDDGQSWQAVASGTRSSITGIVAVGSRVMAVGLDGVELESRDAGRSFSATSRSDRTDLTALAVVPDGSVQVFSVAGVVRP
ncbi:MAG: glycosyl hydrolase [Proteobacteria bacterium]|jgi:photosystem II stability/assembly factor-like uncharacterized protein|nr:glycosyl hydrolase [Pseudomonadota bacterium]